MDDKKYYGLLSDLYDRASKQGYLSAGTSAASGFAQLANASLNYDALNIQSDLTDIQAASVEVQALEKANMLRKSFLEASGNVIAGAAQRGIKTTSANVMDNLEGSAAAIGRDIQKLHKNAALQADVLRTQAKMNRRSAQASLVSGVLNSFGSFASSVGSYAYAKDSKNRSTEYAKKAKGG